jgi:hypothetical protein
MVVPLERSSYFRAKIPLAMIGMMQLAKSTPAIVQLATK